MTSWTDIKEAPKKFVSRQNSYNGPWILGVDKHNEQRVMRWTTEYPCCNGVWMYGYGPTNYIDTILYFYPTHFKMLDDGPNKNKNLDNKL